MQRGRVDNDDKIFHERLYEPWGRSGRWLTAQVRLGPVVEEKYHVPLKELDKSTEYGILLL